VTTSVAAQPVLDVFEDRPEAVVPCCHVCGRTGEQILVDGVGVPQFRAAVLWALLAIDEHVKREHLGGTP
jgi:hypothetical protein